MLVVIALGGNALLRRGEPLDASVQRANVKVAAEAVAEVAADHRVVLTHGNGPQVGLLALQSAACAAVAPYPLDVLDAESEGMVGYLVEQELGRHVPRRRLATLLNQVIVDADDPAFHDPTKPVGPVYSTAEAWRLASQHGWDVAPDGDGGRWRRVVPSPEPKAIVELDAVQILVDHDVLVTCVGGGGIPVVSDGDGLHGVEAVIDKDLSAALLATELGADALLLLTDVDAVYEGWGTPDRSAIRQATPAQLRALGAAAGSMGPKIEAACRFVEAGGRIGAIGALEDAMAILRGQAGTHVVADGGPGPPGSSTVGGMET
jgi:carbamate kinase